MKKNNAKSQIIIFCFIMISFSFGSITKAQQTLWFGTLEIDDKIIQGRFEVFSDSLIKTIVYAPYGISPVTFNDVKQQNKQLTFSWVYNQLTYHCLLFKQDSSAFKGNCICEKKQPIPKKLLQKE